MTGFILIALFLMLIVAVYMLLPNDKKTAAKPQPAPEPQRQATQSSAEVVNTQELNKAKGDAFEKYIVGLFNNQSGRFRIKYWRSDKIAANGMYATESKYPDIHFEFRGDDRIHEFAIECKWRARFAGKGIEWATPNQIQNYLDYERNNRIRVFVAIGIGGTPDAPEGLYVIPLQNVAMYPLVYKTYLSQYERNPRHKFFFSPHNQTLS